MNYHLRIPSLELPTEMPSTATMKSHGTNIHNYEPDSWEFQYEIYCYLSGMTPGQLATRYKEIVRNFGVFVRQDTHKIPIGCLFGSWYWYRKEHQTRYEFFQRKLELPCEPPTEVVNLSRVPAPFQARFPDANLIFRYGKLEWMREFLEGSVRIAAAHNYYAMENDGARFDNELTKQRFMLAQYTKVRTAGGQEIPLKSDVRSTISAPNYYVLCASCEWDPNLFEVFEADACVVIRKPGSFGDRLRSATASELPGWYFHDNPVLYFDPYEWKKDQPFHAPNCKDFRFAYQREYRFLWDPLALQVSGFGAWKVNVEPLNDIAELYDPSGALLA
jgi:hypothetical protein